MNIEIFERVTGRVIETKDIPEDAFRAFKFYWRSQANTYAYGWRIKGTEAGKNVCPGCGKRFPDQERLERHLDLHNTKDCG